MIGKTISHYKILEKLGQGGMGVVYLAEDLKLKRKVALKFLPPQYHADEGEKNRFMHEARAASALDHHHVCTIHEINETDDGQLFIVMAYYQGQTLKERIARGPLPVDEAVDIFRQLVEGLGEAHRAGIVHRDIKPANIMLTTQGRIKILDFGLAKLKGQTRITRTGTTLGTLAYSSPEQLQGQALDQRTDLWSLGVVLAEMLTGRLPFAGDYQQALMYAILHEDPELGDSVPAGLKNIVLRCMVKDLKDRIATAQELSGMLAAYLDQDEPTVPLIGSVGEGLKPWWRRWPGVTLAVMGWAALVVGVSLLGIRLNWFEGGGTGKAIRLAVLPFDNLSGDPDQEYLSDGLTQEMITHLGRLNPEGLRVIARTSVMRYKESVTPVEQVGEELKVDYILEGSAQREAEQVRVTARLIRVEDQSQLWSEGFLRQMSGILALQNDVARRVAEALALQLLPGERALLTAARPVDSEAYDLYLKGMHYWYRLNPGDLDISLGYFTASLEKDPDFARAYVGVSLVWMGRQQGGIIPPHEAGPRIKEAVGQALALDEGCLEAYYALALVETWTDWDWASAEQSFTHVLEKNPGFADARIYYSHLLAITGRMDQAVEQGRRALEFDPFNNLFKGLYAMVLCHARRYDEANNVAREVLRAAPQNVPALFALWISSSRKGKPAEAFKALKDVLNIYYADRDRDEAMDQGWAQGGYFEAMNRGATALARRFRESYAAPYDVAIIYAEAGKDQQALEWLERSYDVRDPNLPYIGMPVFEDLFSQPRYQALARRMNLPVPAPQPAR